MRDDHGLYHRLRAILFVLVIEWTSAQCVPRTTQWRLVISQEYDWWEAYVYEINLFEGTLGLASSYAGDNCTFAGHQTTNPGSRAFDGSTATWWQTCYYKVGGWVRFNLSAPAAV